MFTGQIWEADLGLYNYRARFYDPLTGSFTQPDSLVPDAMDPRAWNRFGYVYGNPANFTDPSGHFPWLALGVAAVVAGGLNVGVNATSAYLNNGQYSLGDAGWDFGIGAFYGGAAFLIGLAPIHVAFRLPLLGGLSVAEGSTTALVKGRQFSTNDALWAFLTGTAFAGGGHLIGRYFNKKIGTLEGRIDAYESSLRATHRSIRAMNSANMAKAAKISQYMIEFPNSQMIKELAKYHMSKYVEWNKIYFRPPLPKPSSVEGTVAALRGLSTVAGAFLADNEYLGLLPPPPMIRDPYIWMAAR